MKNLVKILTIMLLVATVMNAYADNGRNQGAVNNLCRNLMNACFNGDKQSCEAARNVGCACNEKTGTCSRGNYN